MTGWAALLRAVNVGGTGKLPMAELKALCEVLGFERVQTYIASGNVVFASKRSETELREAIEAALLKQYGKQFGVMVRSAAELAGLVAGPITLATASLRSLSMGRCHLMALQASATRRWSWATAQSMSIITTAWPTLGCASRQQNLALRAT